MCNKEENDMTVAERIDQAALGKAVPEERIPHILGALDEVEDMLNGGKPMKSARDFLSKMREKKGL